MLGFVCDMLFYRFWHAGDKSMHLVAQNNVYFEMTFVLQQLPFWSKTSNYQMSFQVSSCTNTWLHIPQMFCNNNFKTTCWCFLFFRNRYLFVFSFTSLQCRISSGRSSCQEMLKFCPFQGILDVLKVCNTLIATLAVRRCHWKSPSNFFHCQTV